MGENDTTHDQILKKHSYKKLKVEDWSCDKNGLLL